MQRTNKLVKAQTNIFRMYTVNSHGNMKVKCILSSCNKRQAGSMNSTWFKQLQQKQTVNHSLSMLSDLLPYCPLWWQIDFCFQKWHVCSKKCCSMPGGGKGQEWEKCACMVHGKFLHCLQLQSHSKTVQSPSFPLRSGLKSSYYLINGRPVTQRGARGKYPYQRDHSAFNLEGQKKNQISITALKNTKGFPS